MHPSVKFTQADVHFFSCYSLVLLNFDPGVFKNVKSTLFFLVCFEIVILWQLFKLWDLILIKGGGHVGYDAWKAVGLIDLT